MKLIALGLVGTAALVTGYPKYKPKVEEPAKKETPQYDNLNITTLESKEICITWTDNGFQYSLVIPKEGAIGEPQKTPLPPPPPKEEPVVAAPKKEEAPPAPTAPVTLSLSEAPAEGFSQYEDGWQFVWTDKSGDLWVQRFPNKGKSLPAEKYVPSQGAKPAPITPPKKEDVDKVALVTSLHAAVTSIEKNLGVGTNTAGMEGFPIFTKKHKSALSRHLTAPVYAQIVNRQTPSGFTLDQLIQSGLDNPESSVGVWAGDKESYTVFAPLLDPIIADIHHGYSPAASHLHDRVSEDIDEMFNHVPVKSVTLTASRNLSETRLLPAITRSQRRQVEASLAKALASAEGGKYYSVANDAAALKAAGVDFPRGSKFAESAGVHRDFPDARGVFVGSNFVAYVNDEEMLRVELTQPGNSLVQAFNKLDGLLHNVEDALGERFLHDTHLGYVTASPARLGTALEAAVEVELPRVAALPDLASRACLLGVNAERRGDAVVITAGSTLGQSERSQLARLAVGIAGLAALDRSLADA